MDLEFACQQTLFYRSRTAVKDAAAIERMKQASGEYPGDGDRRVRIFPDRDGHRISLVGRAGPGVWRS